MRSLLALVAAALAVAAHSQAPSGGPTEPQSGGQPKQEQPAGPGPESVFASMPPPDATLVIRKHRLGPDLVSISMQREDYPADLLRKQCLEIGAMLGSQPRGLEVGVQTIEGPRPFRMLRATFAVDGLLDVANGQVDLQALARAFAGAAAPFTVDSLQVSLDGFVPTERTLKTFSSKGVDLAANLLREPSGVEYRLHLKSQIPAEIVIPKDPAQAPPKGGGNLEPAMPEWALWTLLTAGALSLAVLVYFAALRAPRR